MYLYSEIHKLFYQSQSGLLRRSLLNLHLQIRIFISIRKNSFVKVFKSKKIICDYREKILLYVSV